MWLSSSAYRGSGRNGRAARIKKWRMERITRQKLNLRVRIGMLALVVRHFQATSFFLLPFFETMNPDKVPTPSNEQYDPNLDAQDEELTSGGNNRLMYILVAVVLVLVLGYVALPKGEGSGLSSVTPSFMLDDAAVTATAPTSADSIAAGLKADPAAAATATTTTTLRPVAKPVAARPVAAAPVAAASNNANPAPEAPVASAPAAAAPAPAPAAAAPEPAAPSNVTMSGKIDDENGRPLVGATVLLKGSSKGTSTDANGNYSLEVPSSGDNTLIYGYGGYDDEVVRSRGSQPVNVTLTPRAKASRKRR
ncbi:MAG: hypothetical protein JWR44_686 [Hymenobacter sp.]|nr:hypothetical protein [Hymenobacter sp.]